MNLSSFSLAQLVWLLGMACGCVNLHIDFCYFKEMGDFCTQASCVREHFVFAVRESTEFVINVPAFVPL